MAIREFGQSLLGDVRERKDQQAQDARDYAKKQDRKELLLTGGAFLGGQIFKAATSNLETKTQDFLARSELQNNNILMTKAAGQIESNLKDRTAAKEKNISLTQYYAEDIATKDFNQKKITNPSAYKKNEDAYWIADFAKRDEIVTQAQQLADTNDTVYSKSVEFAAGKASGKTLSALAERQDRGLTRSFLDRLTGNTRTVDVFNSTMNELKQVKIAKELYDLSPERLAAAEKVAALTGSVGQGLKAAGISMNENDFKRVRDDIAKNQKTTYDTTFQTDVAGNLQAITVGTTTDVAGTIVETPSIVTKQLGADGKPPTLSEATDFVKTRNTIFDNVRNLVSTQGYDDFIAKAAQEGFMKDMEKMEALDLLKLQVFSLDYKNYTSVENFKPSLSEEQQAARNAVLKESKGILGLLLNPKATSEEQEDATKRLLKVMTMVTDASLGSPIISNPREAGEETTDRPVGLPANARKAPDGFYYIPDIDRLGYYERIEG